MLYTLQEASRSGKPFKYINNIDDEWVVAVEDGVMQIMREMISLPTLEKANEWLLDALYGKQFEVKVNN